MKKFRVSRRIKHYIHCKVAILIFVAVILTLLKVYAHFELPEHVTKVADHASLICDLYFIVKESAEVTEVSA